MNKLVTAVCALCLSIPGGLIAGSPFDPPHKSVSSSGQFVIYCDDTTMRFAVTGFCEDTKAGILHLLGQNFDGWKIPIVVTFFRPDPTAPGQQLVQILPINVEGGGKKIVLNIILRGDLAEIRFQEQLVHAILLEMEYRDKPAWQEGVAAIDPPHWLVEGLTTYLRNRNTDLDVDVYKTLLTNSDLPSVGDFLTQNLAGMNAASLKLYQAYSFSFLQLLIGLPNGQQALSAYIRDLPLGQDTPSQDLMKHFPALGGSSDSLEKWWTLSVARLSASDRFKGLSLEETEQRLTTLLKLKIPVDKKGGTKEFALDDFKDFIKNPLAKPVLADEVRNMEILGTEANPLYRPIIGEYLSVSRELLTGKAKRPAERLKDVAKYRELILNRMDQIADYLNWFEATQVANRSDSFQDYITTAKEISNNSDAPKHNDPISRYMDSLEIQMQ